jgi:hypothetical protein
MKRLSPEAARTTIVIPPEILKAVQEKSKRCGTDLSTYIAFSLLRTLHDESFTIDIMMSEEFLDHQLDI